MQNSFKRAFVSAMDFSIFIWCFLTIIEEKPRFVDGAFADTFFKIFFTLFNNFT